MRAWCGYAIVIGLGMAISPGSGNAQEPVILQGTSTPTPKGYFEAPGFYGTSYGTASYKVPRTYSEFASPFGVGYGYGYAPYGLIPNRYGMGLWRPGAVEAKGMIYGASNYQTWEVPGATAGGQIPLPSIGLYAPAFGSTGPLSW